ncbi:MAG: hypothetical protein P0S94_01545, partial [Simkaniaceae bacterium]|nr:hypothetical protein [Simkaniaceae bacterium]
CQLGLLALLSLHNPRQPHVEDLYAAHRIYHYWNSHNESGAYGKLFPYDGNSLFFDDHVNIEEGMLNVVAPVCTVSGQPIETQHLVKHGQVVKAMILDALMDDSYYEKWHQRHQALRATQLVPHWLLPYRHHTQ